MKTILIRIFITLYLSVLFGCAYQGPAINDDPPNVLGFDETCYNYLAMRFQEVNGTDLFNRDVEIRIEEICQGYFDGIPENLSQ